VTQKSAHSVIWNVLVRAWCLSTHFHYRYKLGKARVEWRWLEVKGSLKCWQDELEVEVEWKYTTVSRGESLKSKGRSSSEFMRTGRRTGWSFDATDYLRDKLHLLFGCTNSLPSEVVSSFWCDVSIKIVQLSFRCHRRRTKITWCAVSYHQNDFYAWWRIIGTVEQVMRDFQECRLMGGHILRTCKVVPGWCK
jgi:hypothetical protein